jgi:hypothetical protein
MCHKKREPHDNVNAVPGVVFEASGIRILFGRDTGDTGQRKFFQSDSTMSDTFSDILNLNSCHGVRALTDETTSSFFLCYPLQPLLIVLEEDSWNLQCPEWRRPLQSFVSFPVD